jgi:hypothetical protein
LTRQSPVEEDLLRRYLVGLVSDTERERVEELYFADSTAFGDLSAVESALIDEYVGGTLPEGFRNGFEARFLASVGGRERVEFARALARQCAGARPARSRPIAWTSVAAGLCLLAAGGLWLGRQAGPRSDGGGIRAQTATKPAAVLSAALVLTPGSVRGEAATPRLVLVPDAQLVVLEAPLEATLPRLLAVIRSASGQEVWRQQDPELQISPSARVAVLRVPASLLPPDDYVVTLFGGPQTERELDYYPFGIRRAEPR